MVPSRWEKITTLALDLSAWTLEGGCIATADVMTGVGSLGDDIDLYNKTVHSDPLLVILG